MARNIFNRISKSILRLRYSRLYSRLFWHYAEKYSTAEEAGFHTSVAFEWLTGTEWATWVRDSLPKVRRKTSDRRPNVPTKYRDWFYLRDMDLHAERLADCPHDVCDEMCMELDAHNLLFKSREEAEAARTVMLNAHSKPPTLDPTRKILS